MNCLFYSPWIVKSPFYSSWNVILVIYFFFWNVKRRIYCPWNVKRPVDFTWKVINTHPPPPPLPSPTYKHKSANTICYTKWRIQGRGPGGPAPPLFLDQTEARRAEKFFWETGPPSLCQGLDYRAPPLSEGLDPPLIQTSQNTCKTL